jgi:hypothetical protein
MQQFCLPNSLLSLDKNKIFSFYLGASHKLLIAYRDEIFEYCLLSGTYYQISIPSFKAHNMLLQAGDIIDIKLSPDDSHLLIFYQGFVLVFFCKNETSEWASQHYYYSDFFELPKKYRCHFVFLPKRLYALRIEWQAGGANHLRRIQLACQDTNQIESILESFASSVLIASYCRCYVLYFEKYANKYSLRVHSLKEKRIIKCLTTDNVENLNIQVTKFHFLWFENNQLHVFCFKENMFFTQTMTINIAGISSHPNSTHILVLLTTGDAHHLDLKAKVILSSQKDVVHAQWITSTLASVKDKLNYWSFHRSPNGPSIIDDYLLREYNLPVGSHAIFWVDRADWPPYRNSRWFSAMSHTYELNHPGYNAGMQAAYSYAEKCVQNREELTFDKMMKIHQEIISPLSQRNTLDGFFHEGAIVQYGDFSKKQYAVFTEQSFIESLESGYCDVVLDGEYFECSQPLSFTLKADLDKSSLTLIGLASLSETCEAEMRELINTRLNNIKGDTTKETIDNIAKFIFFYHRFHIVSDGSGRLVLVVLHYLLHWHKLKPSLIFAPHLPSTLGWKDMAYFIKIGQVLFEQMCARNITGVKARIEIESQNLPQSSALFKKEITAQGEKTRVELLVRHHFSNLYVHKEDPSNGF